MGQFSVTIYGHTGSVLSDNQQLPLILLAMLPECGTSEGDIQAYLILQSREGEVRHFSLGNRNGFHECADMALVEFENTNIKTQAFWANPEFTYGGVRAGNEDWVPYRKIGFSCSRPKPDDGELFPLR